MYQAMCPKLGLTVAVKSIPRFRLLDNRYRQLFESELKILEAVDHPFVVMFYNLITDDDTFNLILEYCNDSLARFIAEGRHISERLVEKYFCELIAGVHYLHRGLRVVHRDLKLENLLIDSNGDLKITDFGLSKALSDPTDLCHTACGTEPYLAPELVRNEPYTEKVDIWQIGIVLYVIAFRRFPFTCGNEARLLHEIQTKDPEFPEGVDPLLRDLIVQLLTKDPRARPKIEDVLEHAWVKRSSFRSLASWPIVPCRGLVCEPEIESGVLRETERLGFSRERATELGTDDAMFYRMIKRREIVRMLAKGWTPKDASLAGLNHPLREKIPATCTVQSFRGHQEPSILSEVMKRLGRARRCDAASGRPASVQILTPVVQMDARNSATRRPFSKSTLLVKNYRFRPKNRIV